MINTGICVAFLLLSDIFAQTLILVSLSERKRKLPELSVEKTNKHVLSNQISPVGFSREIELFPLASLSTILLTSSQQQPAGRIVQGPFHTGYKTRPAGGPGL